MRTLLTVLVAIGLLATASIAQPAEKQVELDTDGVAHLPAFAVPPSAFSSDEARRRWIEYGRQASRARAAGESARSRDISTTEKILELRRSSNTARKKTVEDMLQTFPVTVTPQTIGGIQTDVVMPRQGVSARNRHRVLINLHGGGMLFGARYEGQVASIPIAGLGGHKVITVDYRMAPEHHFPAASEDVAEVYRALLKSHRPQNIGIFGCSAGAILTAEAVAWFQRHALPNPGAISLDGGGAAFPDRGDSFYFGNAFTYGVPAYPSDGSDFISQLGKHYWRGELSDALAFPAGHPELLARFPPTLVINSTRDASMSSAVFTHAQLVKAGAKANLHIWEGVRHCFTYDHELPEAREAYDVLIRFFDEHLGREPR